MDTMVIEARMNGLRTQSIRALMRQGRQVRLVEVVRPALEDPAAYVDRNAEALWEAAAPAPASLWMAARERGYRDYYYGIIRAVDGVRATGGTLDMALAEALSAVDEDEAKRGEFDQWRAMTQLEAQHIQTTQDKRDLLVAVLAFANAGLVGGARLG